MTPQPPPGHPFPNSQVPDRYEAILDAYKTWFEHATWVHHYLDIRPNGDATSWFPLRNKDIRFLVCPAPVSPQQTWADISGGSETVHDFLTRIREDLAGRLPHEIPQQIRLHLVDAAWEYSPKIEPGNRGFPSRRAFTEYLTNLCEWGYLSREDTRGPYQINPRRRIQRCFEQPISTRRLIGAGFLHGFPEPEELKRDELDMIDKANDHIQQAVEILCDIQTRRSSWKEATSGIQALLTLPIPFNLEKFPQFEERLKAWAEGSEPLF